MEKVDLIYPDVREDYYEIDTDGNIYIKSTGELRKTFINNGYVYVTCVGITRKYTKVSVHRAIGYTFLGLVKGLEMNHIDADKTHNAIDNLEVVTGKENIRHAIENDLSPRGERHKNSTYNDTIVQEICKYLEDGMNNLSVCENILNCDYNKDDKKHRNLLLQIGKIRRKSRWTHISDNYIFPTKVYGTDLKRNK